MSFKNNVLEGSGLDFGGPRARYWRVWGLFFETFANFLTCCLEDVPPIFPPEIPPHVGRADAPKKMRICRVTERLPRIARLPHLKTQTPRTPRTPRVKSSTTTAENKRVGRRWSPPGGLQFLVQEAADQIATTGWPAPRAGLALLFLLQEGRRPNRHKRSAGA